MPTKPADDLLQASIVLCHSKIGQERVCVAMSDICLDEPPEVGNDDPESASWPKHPLRLEQKAFGLAPAEMLEHVRAVDRIHRFGTERQAERTAVATSGTGAQAGERRL